MMAGPLYERGMHVLPKADESHRVPSGYWKIVAIREGAEIRLSAFAFDQETPRSDNFYAHQVAVDSIEQRSGLNFFHALDEPSQERLEEQMGLLASQLGCSAS